MLYLNRSRKNKGQGMAIAAVVGVMALIAAAATNLKGCGNTVTIDASGMQITCGNSLSGTATTTGTANLGGEVARAPGDSTDPSGNTTGTAQASPPVEEQPGEVTTDSPDGQAGALTGASDGTAAAPVTQPEPSPQASPPPEETAAVDPEPDATTSALQNSRIWVMNPTGDAMVETATR